ncbi:MAG TPA: endopeptidase La [Candidatus Limnocylindrales bacterium]|nr:endopeptidase La [Candidatus Limnocylindrales bacterium]
MATPPPTDPGEFVIPDTLPVLPLRDAVVLPMTAVPLVVGQPRSVQLVDDVMRGNRMLALVTQRDPATEPAKLEDLHRMGTVGMIHQLARVPDGTVRIMVQGIERIRLSDLVQTEPYVVARVEVAREQPVTGPELDGVRRAVVDIFRRLVEVSAELPDELAVAADNVADPRHVAYFIASVVPVDTAARQALLEAEPITAKLHRLVDILQRELAVRELGRKITSETEERLTKKQREYYLREQLRSIQRELGQEEERGSETAELRRRLDEAGLPEEARREADRELARLENLSPASPEHGMIVTYLEWMASVPWQKLAGGVIDIHHARRVLDEDHYDLDKIKDRILEYLAVKKLREDRTAKPVEGEAPAPAEPPRVTGDNPAREPILCFVGPPGVGKTSLGQSIARALGRRFVRMSLGGVRDEAEIRGHRRTYIGALPGRIIQALRRAETRDPVFMLDEIDKIGADWRGDPSSALLEVLDPAQNHAFVDNYLGVAFDLSQVLFIATANTLDTIPGPLRNRMEVLMLSGYTDEEKVGIARQYLIGKQLAAHSLAPDELSFDLDAIRDIVRGYTREAGVRSLDREIATVARKVARGVAEGRREPIRVTVGNVAEYLGRPKFFDEVAERTRRPGVATGLAWTPVGGDVLFVEVTMMPSTEERLILTGMLGDVMRESAQAAVSYVWSNAEALDIDPRIFEGKAIHVHVPAGAIPKDGPSAGVTMVTALASLATRRPVRSELAMTGEITLRGKVLPVGGIKEKVLAAHRTGIRTVILPRRNERDTEDVPEEVRRELAFVFVDDAEEVLRQALDAVPQPVS